MSADRGLDSTGFIRREGAPGLVQTDFAPLVSDYVAGVRRALGDGAVDGIYLYGSVIRGTARPGLSDLDGQVALVEEPTDDVRTRLAALERSLEERHALVRRVDILVDSRARLTDPALRYDEGFHIRVLCTPLWGSDAGAVVAPHRPHLALARAVQGDWRGALDRLGARLADQDEDDAEVCRAVGRRLARLAFTWVMPRWGGWTSDPGRMAQVVSTHEPGWTVPMMDAVLLGWHGRAERKLAGRLLEGWGAELSAAGDRLGA